MADLDYTVGVNTAAAEKNLSNLQKSVGSVNDTFIRFKSTLATISLGALFQNALNLADTLQDLSDATEISTNKILGFSNAIAANGGTTDGAQKGLARLVAEIDGAANSAGASREAFKNVGVSLTDLRTLSSAQIFDKAIKGLAGIDDVATRAALATTLLGKEARNINFKNVSDDFNTASISALRYSDAIKSGADANDNIAKAIKTFQLEVIKLIQPISDLVNNIKISTDTVSRFFDIIGEAVKWAVIIASVIYLGRAIAAIGIAAYAAYGAIAEITGGIAGLARALLSAGTRSALMENLALISGGLGQRVVVMLEAMGINTAFLAKHWMGLTIGIGSAVGALKEWLGLGKGGEGPTGRSYSSEDSKRMQEYLDEQEAKIKRGQEAMAKYKGEVAKANLESKQNIQIQGQALSNLGFRLSFEKSLIGMTEDQKELATQLYNIDVQRFDKQDEYARSIKKLEQERSLTKDEEANKLLGARIGILRAEAKESDAQTERHKQGIKDQLILLQNARIIEAARLQDQQNMVKSIEDQISRRQTLDELLKGASTAVIGPRDQDIGVLNALQQKLYDLGQANRSAAEAAGKNWADSFEGMDMTTEQSAELATGLDAIAAAYGRLYAAQVEFTMANYHNSQSFELGWRKAFSSFKDSAMDTASIVKNSFDNFTRGLEDAIVNFVRTGKLSFNDLANSVVADLTRIAVRKGISAAIGFLGFANGGEPPVGVPSIVGEKGPELFVPKTAGTIIPNHKLGGGGGSPLGESMPTTVNYNIQAVDASSFRSLVARDPGFIYSVTEAGRRSQPSRRGV